MDSIETKFCKKCSRDLPRTEEYYFRLYDHFNEKYKWDAYCKECKNNLSASYSKKQSAKGRYSKNPEVSTIVIENKELAKQGLRKCTQCKQVKPRDKENFRWDHTGLNYYGKCHECDTAAIARAVRSRVVKVLKGNKPDLRVEELLGCSLEKAKAHLESTWVEGMCWANHGLYGWHIDHIRPCASFNLKNEEELLACFNYKNLQALWAKDNLNKSSKWEPDGAVR